MFKEPNHNRIDWRLLQNGAVSLFWRAEYLEEAQRELAGLGYEIIEVAYTSLDQFKHDLSVALKWEEQFGYSAWGGNLNALNDGLGWFSSEGPSRVALCFTRFHGLWRADKRIAHALLDMIESESRDALLVGKHLICLVQTNDANFHPDGLGGRTAQWNEREWLNAKRGL